jgi:hypothetical protein
MLNITGRKVTFFIMPENGREGSRQVEAKRRRDIPAFLLENVI